MFYDTPEYQIIRREACDFEVMQSTNIVLFDFVFKELDGVPCDDILFGDDYNELYKFTDIIFGYKARPKFDYIFDLEYISHFDPLVREIEEWCRENLQEFNIFTGDVLRGTVLRPSASLYLTSAIPMFEIQNEEDAMAFKLTWVK